MIVGPNAVGKTNLIEAVQLLTEADSFRKPSWGDVVRWTSESASLSLGAEDGERRHDVRLMISAAGKRNYTVNGKAKKSVSQVSGRIPCVVFTPDDLRIVKDSAERRRSSLDGVGAQLSHTYGTLRRDYERVVRQRNSLLKQDVVDEDTLASWDERLVNLGSRLATHREGLFSRIVEKMIDVHEEMAPGGEPGARYEPSWARDGVSGGVENARAAMEAHLALKRGEERARRLTLVGPHRDEIVFTLAGRDVRAFASQGQQRTIALALKLAEVAVVADVSGKRPVLLLDDVMSELDEERRHALAATVGGVAQTIMTTTNLGYFDESLIERAQVVSLS